MKKSLSLFFALLLAGVHAAQAAKQTTYDLTFVSYESMYSAENNDVFLILYTADYSFTFRLDIIVEQGQQFFTSGKTYTWADMMTQFCYTYVSAEYCERPFRDANFTWTRDSLGLEHMAGYAVDTFGNTYNFHYDVLPFIPTGDTIAVDFTNTLKLEHQTEWYFSGTSSDETYYLLLTLFNDGDSPIGHYDTENVDTAYSYLDVTAGEGESNMLSFHDATVDITAGAGDTLLIEAFLTAMDGNVYHVHAFYLEPKALYRDTITATNLYINTDYLYGMVGAIRVEASDDQHEVVLALSPMTADLSVYDTYQISPTTSNIGHVTHYSGAETQYDVYNGAITIERADNGAVVTGTLLCYNNVEYTIHLTYADAQPTREEELSIDGMTLQLSTEGAWRISGYSADSTIFVSAVFNGEQIPGYYTCVEMGRDFSYVVTDITWLHGDVNTYTYYDLVNAKLTAVVEPADSTITVTGTMVGQYITDIPLFHVNLSTRPRRQSALLTTTATPAPGTKRLINGRLYIIRDGKTYDALGREMK